MKEQEFSVQDIKELMSAMNKNHISGLRLIRDGFTLELERGAAHAAAPAAAAQPTVSAHEGTEEPEYAGEEVRSPIVGTFYAAPAPGKPSFVKVGSRVKKGDVLFIIESMKLMNEVLSEHDGVVESILVQDGQGVEYGQPILRLSAD